MTRDQVVHQKHDSNDNPVGRSNQNTILDICLYDVEFPGGEITEMVANIGESMYTECDVIWNEYLLLMAFIDHRKNDSALSVED